MAAESVNPSTPQTPPPASWPVLDRYERRVLGVLVEKAKTTPEAYPLSLNALVTGSNQKSNRDPQMELEDLDVEDALSRLQKKGLTTGITGSGRVERFKHNLYDAWKVDKVELAVLTELLLRGPQTEGDLRGRASRMEPIADLDVLRDILHKLAARKLVVYLTPEGRRGTTVTHGFHEPGEVQALRKKHADGAGPEPVPAAAPARVAPAPAPAPVHAATPVQAPPATAALEEKVKSLEAALTQTRGEVEQLRSQVAELRTAHTSLAQDLAKLKEALGA